MAGDVGRALPSQRRGLTVPALADLDRDRRRRLVHALVAESELLIRGHVRGLNHDDYTVESHPVWRARRSIIRIYYSHVSGDDLADLKRQAASEGMAEVVAVIAAETESFDVGGLDILSPEKLIARLEASALVRWDDDGPDADPAQYARVANRTQEMLLADSLGIRMLPVAALNKLPPEVAALRARPDSLFEKLTFRIFTASFRFEGRLLGAQESGKRVPDAVLTWTGVEGPLKVILDCKAARDGYVMNTADERAICEYVLGANEQSGSGHSVSHVLVVSSGFPGGAGKAPHPYFARAASVAAQTGAKLVYACATDLADLSLAIEESCADTGKRLAYPWPGVLDRGLIEPGSLSVPTPAID
jgi:hypothetical protein